LTSPHLIDKSAIARRFTSPAVREQIEPLVVRGDAVTCGICDLELLYSARSPSEYHATAKALRQLKRLPVTEAAVDRALEVQAALAERSQHRGVPLPDLLIAAVAELGGATVLHYDADFDRIAEVTGQPTRWIVPRGSVA